MHLDGIDDVAVSTLFDLLPSPQRHGIGTRHARRLQEPVGVQVHIQAIHLRQLGRDRNGRPVAIHVPGRCAIHDVRLARRRLRRVATFPAHPVLPRCGIQARFAVERLHARLGLIVDGAGVVGHRIDARPVDVHRVLTCLADRTAVASAGVTDTRQIGLSDFLGDRSQQRHGVNITRGELLGGHRPAGQGQKSGENNRKSKLSQHTALSIRKRCETWKRQGISQTSSEFKF